MREPTERELLIERLRTRAVSLDDICHEEAAFDAAILREAAAALSSRQEPWYVTEEGMKWSAYDVTYRPDDPAALPPAPETTHTLLEDAARLLEAHAYVETASNVRSAMVEIPNVPLSALAAPSAAGLVSPEDFGLPDIPPITFKPNSDEELVGKRDYDALRAAAERIARNREFWKTEVETLREENTELEKLAATRMDRLVSYGEQLQIVRDAAERAGISEDQDAKEYIRAYVSYVSAAERLEEALKLADWRTQQCTENWNAKVAAEQQIAGLKELLSLERAAREENVMGWQAKLESATQRAESNARVIESLRPFIEEVWSSHRDPQSGDYNECEKHECRWCEQTHAALARAKTEEGK